MKELEHKVETLQTEISQLQHQLWKSKNECIMLASDQIPTATEIIEKEEILRVRG